MKHARNVAEEYEDAQALFHAADLAWKEASWTHLGLLRARQRLSPQDGPSPEELQAERDSQAAWQNFCRAREELARLESLSRKQRRRKAAPGDELDPDEGATG